MDGWVDGRTDGWMDGWMDGLMDGWMDGRMDGWMGGRREGDRSIIRLRVHIHKTSSCTKVPVESRTWSHVIENNSHTHTTETCAHGTLTNRCPWQPFSPPSLPPLVFVLAGLNENKQVAEFMLRCTNRFRCVDVLCYWIDGLGDKLCDDDTRQQHQEQQQQQLRQQQHQQQHHQQQQQHQQQHQHSVFHTCTTILICRSVYRGASLTIASLNLTVK